MSINWEEKYKDEIRKKKDYQFCITQIYDASRNNGTAFNNSYSREFELNKEELALALADYKQYNAKIVLYQESSRNYVYMTTVDWWKFKKGELVIDQSQKVEDPSIEQFKTKYVRPTEDYQFCKNLICGAGARGGTSQNNSYSRTCAVDKSTMEIALADYKKYNAQIRLIHDDDRDCVYEATVDWWQFRN